jgi:hypothetical protein
VYANFITPSCLPVQTSVTVALLALPSHGLRSSADTVTDRSAGDKLISRTATRPSASLSGLAQICSMMKRAKEQAWSSGEARGDSVSSCARVRCVCVCVCVCVCGMRACSHHKNSLTTNIQHFNDSIIAVVATHLPHRKRDVVCTTATCTLLGNGDKRLARRAHRTTSMTMPSLPKRTCVLR